MDEEWIAKINSALPEFPDARRDRYIKDFSLPYSDADEITQDKYFADYFENAVDNLSDKESSSYKNVSNLVRSDVRRILNEEKINIDKFTVPEKIIAMIAESVTSGNVSATASKEIFNAVLKGNSEDEMLSLFKKAESDFSQVSDSSELESIVKKILEDNPKEVDRYKRGEKKLAGLFVGKIMQESKGKANPKIVNELLIKFLEIETE